MPDIRVEYNEKEETWDIFLYVNEKCIKKIATCYEESYRIYEWESPCASDVGWERNCFFIFDKRYISI